MYVKPDELRIVNARPRALARRSVCNIPSLRLLLGQRHSSESLQALGKRARVAMRCDAVPETRFAVREENGYQDQSIRSKTRGPASLLNTCVRLLLALVSTSVTKAGCLFSPAELAIRCVAALRVEQASGCRGSTTKHVIHCL
jgi:hypothetical protein